MAATLTPGTPGQSGCHRSVLDTRPAVIKCRHGEGANILLPLTGAAGGILLP